MSQKTDRVIAEILQKRDRFTKNFRTENHGGAAVIYGCPVHYKEGEEWKEIDNRLEKTENGYQNHASRVKVHFAESESQPELVFAKMPTEQELSTRGAITENIPLRIFITDSIRIEIMPDCPPELLYVFVRSLKEHA